MDSIEPERPASLSTESETLPASPLAAANPAVEIVEEVLPPPDETGLGSLQSVAAVCLCGVVHDPQMEAA